MKNIFHYSFSTIPLLGLVAILFISSSKSSIQQTIPWAAPSSADTIKNPLKGNLKATDDGKKLYALNCVVCHGDKGKGNGIAAAGLNPKPADHSSEKVQKQTDGAIFWKMTTGRPPMASYASILTTSQRWSLVNYIRTLKTVDKPLATAVKK
jgi:mono/diheme cytochrome c family protein